MYNKRRGNAVYKRLYCISQRALFTFDSCAADIIHWQVYDWELEVFIRQIEQVELKKKKKRIGL